jgi:hypothetical protein
MNTTMLASLLVIGLTAAAIGGGATGAFFSDMETSAGNTIAAGVLDLQVNGKDDPVGTVVNVQDLKPSTWQEVRINLTLKDNPGKLWKHINLSDEVMSTGVVTEPECREQGGTWSNGQCTGMTNDNNDLLPVTDFDLKVSVNGAANATIIDPSQGVSVYDARSCWIPLGTVGAPGQTTNVTVYQSFHLRDSVTNWAQGDVNTFKEEFLVTQTNAPDPTYPNPQYPRVWDPVNKKCKAP